MKKKTPNPDSEYKPFDSEGNKKSSTSKPVTFEDLLREIQQSKVSQPEVKQTPKKEKYVYETPKYVDYDDNLQDEERSLENVNYKSDDEIYNTYEQAKKEAFNRPSYEDSEVDFKDSVLRFSHFKEYDTLSVPSEAQNIARELKNPDNIKRAIVLSEILNRRY
jgi:hypothetical protein